MVEIFASHLKSNLAREKDGGAELHGPHGRAHVPLDGDRRDDVEGKVVERGHERGGVDCVSRRMIHG